MNERKKKSFYCDRTNKSLKRMKKKGNNTHHIWNLWVRERDSMCVWERKNNSEKDKIENKQANGEIFRTRWTVLTLILRFCYIVSKKIYISACKCDAQQM